VIFAPNGALQQTIGNTFPIGSDLEVAPKLTAAEATLAAARFIATPDTSETGEKDQFGQLLPQPSVNVTAFKPKVIAAFPDIPEHPTVLDRGPFGDFIKASLIWFPLRNGLRLCWEVVIAMPVNQGLFRVLITTDTGQIVYCAQLTRFIAAQGNVFLV